MITIGITVCDNDYENCQKVLDQIKHKVKVKHEVIIIDNREKFKDVKTKWKPTYSFGYNAYQFAARSKIIELAKGDYLWFIDGDDEILELKSFDYTEDIVVYSFYSCSYLNHFEDEVIYNNIFSNNTLLKITCVLWNKIIKKSLFNGLDLKEFQKHKVVSMEDTTYVVIALKNAKTIRTTKQVLYNYILGMSSVHSIKDSMIFKTLSTGFDYISRLLKSEMLENMCFYNDLIQNQCRYMITYILKSMSFIDSDRRDLVCDLIKINLKLFPKNIFLPIFAETCAEQICRIGYQNEVKNTLIDFYKDPNLSIQLSFTAPFYDEKNKKMSEKTFVQTTPISSLFLYKQPQKWKYKLSVISLIKDDNTLDHLLNGFYRIKLDKELIIVDLRDSKKDIPQDNNIKVIKNVNSCMDYRSEGIKASSGNYIWFVNPEDDIAEILNINYGDSDIISFPYINKFGIRINQTDGEYNNTNKDEWDDGCIRQLGTPLWNKWFKKDLLEQTFKDLSNTNYDNTERSLIFYKSLKYATKICMIDTVSTIYWNKQCDYKVLSNTIKSKSDVISFFENINKDVDTICSFNFIDTNAKETFKNETVLFCLRLMLNLDSKLLKLFANILKKKYGANYVYTVFINSCIGNTDEGSPIKHLIKP